MAAFSLAVKIASVATFCLLFIAATMWAQPGFVAVAFAPACVFWVLDGYYIHHELLFRAHYDAVRIKTAYAPGDYFSMDTRPYEAKVPTWTAATVSRTPLLFHGAIIAAVFFALAIL